MLVVIGAAGDDCNGVGTIVAAELVELRGGCSVVELGETWW